MIEFKSNPPRPRQPDRAAINIIYSERSQNEKKQVCWGFEGRVGRDGRLLVVAESGLSSAFVLVLPVNIVLADVDYEDYAFVEFPNYTNIHIYTA